MLEHLENYREQMWQELIRAAMVPAHIFRGQAMQHTKSEKERREEAASTVPAMVCPNCLQVVTAIDCKNSYTLPDGTVIQPIPPAPIPVGLQPFFYTGQPCQCRLPNWWAGHWTAEMVRRLEGKPSRPVAYQSKAERDLMEQRLTTKLTALYQLEQQYSVIHPLWQTVKVWSVIVADAIASLHPGEQNVSRKTHKSTQWPVKPWETLLLGEWSGCDDLMPNKVETKQPIDPILPVSGGGASLSEIFNAHNQKTAKLMTAGTPEYLTAHGVNIEHVKAAWEILACGNCPDSFVRVLNRHNLKLRSATINDAAHALGQHCNTGQTLPAMIGEFLVEFAQECQQTGMIIPANPKPVSGPKEVSPPVTKVKKVSRRRRTIRHPDE